MKSPHHMTMRELIALPVITGVEALAAGVGLDSSVPGGAFTDRDGRLWLTLRTEDGWVRYPAYLALLAAAAPARRRVTEIAAEPADTGQLVGQAVGL